MIKERFHLKAMQKAYEAGKVAKTNGLPIETHTGWGYPKGKYYGWFCMGYNGKPFVDFCDGYASAKAVSLLRLEIRRNPHLSRDEAIVLAFARYISSRE